MSRPHSRRSVAPSRARRYGWPMAFEEDAKLVRDHLELVHRLITELAEAVLRVAEETETSPVELAQMVGMGGGGLHNLMQPLLQRHQEEMMRKHLELQRTAQDDK